MRHSRKIFFVSFAFLLTISILSQCMVKDDVVTIKNTEGEQYVGSASCKTCHRSVYSSFINTAHYNDSRPASEKTIKGSFEKNKNYFLYGFNINQAVVMEDRDSGFYEVAYINRKEKEAHRFDIVIGSARKGQSYLYWNANKLFQLPISYFTPSNSWINSPGYPPDHIVFNRTISGRCLECHSTYAKQPEPKNAVEARPSTDFDHNQIIYGIDCERCHGPAAKHVTFHVQNPQEKTGKFILNPAGFSRQQRLDLCALCHSGAREALKPAFSYKPGDTLSNYFKSNPTATTNTNLDVHGNQYGLLLASTCFIKSKTMDCSSCHNTHVKERDNLAVFSQRCMNCHTQSNHTSCKMAATLGNTIKQNCIDCHMPVQASKVLRIQNPASNDMVSAQVRSHLIAIYAEETQKFLKRK